MFGVFGLSRLFRGWRIGRSATTMDPRTFQFLIFAAFGAASLWAGYLARKRGWMDESASRPIHFHTIVWVWSAAAVVSLWRMPLRADALWLIAIQPVLMLLGGYGMIPLARALGCPRPAVGVLAVGAALGNLGFTLGGYLCYSLLQPADDALGYAIFYVQVMQVATVPLVYPLARRFAADTDVPRTGPWSLIRETVLDPRSMPMHGAFAGIALAAFGPPFPHSLQRLHLTDILFYLGALGGYFGIGLRLRIGDSVRHLREHLALAIIKFALFPLASLAAIAAIGLTPWPLGDTARQVVLVQSFMPTAIATVMIANLFHLDARLASVAWLWNTVAFAVLVLPGILLLTA